MTDYIETRSGQSSRYAEYINRRGNNGYEVEHIWANHADRQDEFRHPADFAEYRNRIGGLLLLPKSFNASYSDKPYAEKRGHTSGRTCSPRASTRLRTSTTLGSAGSRRSRACPSPHTRSSRGGSRCPPGHLPSDRRADLEPEKSAARSRGVIEASEFFARDPSGGHALRLPAHRGQR